MKKKLDLMCPSAGACTATVHIEVPADASDDEIHAAMKELAQAHQLVPLHWNEVDGGADPETEHAIVDEVEEPEDAEADVDFVLTRNAEGKLVPQP